MEEALLSRPERIRELIKKFKKEGVISEEMLVNAQSEMERGLREGLIYWAMAAPNIKYLTKMVEALFKLTVSRPASRNTVEFSDPVKGDPKSRTVGELVRDFKLIQKHMHHFKKAAFEALDSLGLLGLVHQKPTPLTLRSEAIENLPGTIRDAFYVYFKMPDVFRAHHVQLALNYRGYRVSKVIALLEALDLIERQPDKSYKKKEPVLESDGREEDDQEST